MEAITRKAREEEMRYSNRWMNYWTKESLNGKRMRNEWTEGLMNKHVDGWMEG
jgi:hypothetical protein